MKDSRYKFFNVTVLGPSRASLMLYGEIGGKDGVDAEGAVAELMSLQQAYPDIDVHINSRGGEVFAGIAIFNALKDAKSRINIYVDGLAASIAGVIALCGKPLHMSRYSRIMLHQVSGGCAGGAKEMRECADLIESLEETLSSMVSRKCGMSAEEVRTTFFDGVDHWFTAQEAFDRHLCDYIYDIDGGEELGTAPTAEQVYEFANSYASTPKQPHMDLIAEIKKDQSFANLTEEQILAKIRTATNQAAKVDALEAKVAALEAEKTEAKKQAVDAYLNQAVSDGRIQSTQLEGFRKLMNADEASARAVIDALPKKAAPSINEFLNGGAAGAGASQDLAKMSWDEIDQAERLAELKDKFPELYKAKFAEKFGA